MFFENDWIMRQINSIVEFIARLVFHRDVVTYEIEDEENLTDTDLLYKRIKALCAQGKICEAEDLLFENPQDDSMEYLALTLDFYQTVGRMSDEELERHNFSRQEIYDGLKEIINRHHGLPVLPFEK